jgi:hypothetical protein
MQFLNREKKGKRNITKKSSWTVHSAWLHKENDSYRKTEKVKDVISKRKIQNCAKTHAQENEKRKILMEIRRQDKEYKTKERQQERLRRRKERANEIYRFHKDLENDLERRKSSDLFAKAK